MPATTRWFLVLNVDEGTDAIDVRYFPAVEGGISATFPHQDRNDLVPRRPWRGGKPCLERRTANFNRHGWSDEPSDLEARVEWKTRRLLAWVDLAAQDGLLQRGDPLELPVGAPINSRSIVGFVEDESGFEFWQKLDIRWGFAHLPLLAGGQAVRLIHRFLDPELGELRNVSPMPRMRPDHGTPNAVWICLPQLPIVPPWQLPENWRELQDVTAKASLDLAAIFRDAGIRLRYWLERMNELTLLLGFPLSSRVDNPSVRMHWLAARLPLSTRMTARKGFRTKEHNHQRWDAELAQSPDALAWVATQNWASDQMRSRGGTTKPLSNSSVLLIGAGALGSAVAVMLVRMGVQSIGIMDNDVLKMGNLVRHELAIESIGALKAQTLADHCNSLTIHAKAAALQGTFPPTQSNIASRIRQYDLVIDCTASDNVLHAMAHFQWQRETQFVSLSITWRGEGLLAYYASEAFFPAHDAIARFQIAPRPDPDVDEAAIEGLGCWHPVFPATHADVHLWAATAIGFIERTLGSRQRTCDYFRRNDKGEITVTACAGDA